MGERQGRHPSPVSPPAYCTGWLTIAATGAWNAGCGCGAERSGHLLRGQCPPAWPWHECELDALELDGDTPEPVTELWRRRGGR